MICLGIESTAHTFGVGIVDGHGKILADERDTFLPPAGQGLKPIDVAAHHVEVRDRLLEAALARASLNMKDIALVAYSQGAGLPPCLRTGHELARSLGRPVIPVCHQVAHLEIARLFSRARDPVFLYVSGGNTQIISAAAGRYRVFGETQDVGIGNALDKFGRAVGMQFPCGPKIEVHAASGSYVELPYVVKGMDLSFSGILTAALQKHKKGAALADLCFSLQETMFAMLTEVTERALAHTGKAEAVLTGGVAANQRLCKMLEVMCVDRGARFAACPLKYAGDNGAMIAWTGLLMHRSRARAPAGDILPRLRTDDVDISWL